MISINELKERYKNHPRLLEVRFINIIEKLVDSVGLTGMYGFLDYVGKNFDNIDVSILHTIINKRPSIKNVVPELKYKQELIFYGFLETNLYNYGVINYLNLHKDSCFSHPNRYHIKKFLNEEWLNDLDYEVVVLRDKLVALNVKNFLDVVRTMGYVLK